MADKACPDGVADPAEAGRIGTQAEVPVCGQPSFPGKPGKVGGGDGRQN